MGALKPALAALKETASRIRREIDFYRLVWKHPRTPKAAKVMIGAALAYAVSPVDLVPDFIPVIGQMDDAVIVTGLIKFALKMIPAQVLAECRESVNSPATKDELF